MVRQPTARQIEVLRFMVYFHAETLRAPTFREVSESLGATSSNTANDHLRALLRKGLISWPEGSKSRAITVTDAGLAALGLKRCPTCRGRGHVA